MKAKFLTAIISTSLLLTACGGHDHPKAVDKLEEAQAHAFEKAPKAEEVKFDDHGQPTFGGVGGVANANKAPATATADATAEAKADAPASDTKADDKADDKADNTATATAEAPKADTTEAKADDKTATAEAPKADEKPAEAESDKK